MRPFTRSDARAFDDFAMRTLGIPGIVLMENAAIGCVQALRELAGSRWPGVRVEIVCGPGNNGGDGYAIARHLCSAGATPRLRPFGVPRAESDAALNAAIATALGIPSEPIGTNSRREAGSEHRPFASRGLAMDDDPPLAALEGDLLVDALFGTGLDREVDARSAAVIEAMNRFDGPRLAVDLPSGLDCDRGVPLGAAVRATVTATMAARKIGFDAPGAAEFTGRVVVVPIGAPVEMWQRK